MRSSPPRSRRPTRTSSSTGARSACAPRSTTALDAVKAELRDFPEAAKESADYLILQQRLRDLQILRATATGNFRVLVPASVPKPPISPKPLRSAILGFAVGLFAGIGLAFLLEQFDTRLRRPEEVPRRCASPSWRASRAFSRADEVPDARDARASRR